MKNDELANGFRIASDCYLFGKDGMVVSALVGSDIDAVESAIRKQIPMKPVVKQLGKDIDVYCPACGDDMIHMDTRKGHPFCCNCGQRFDWGV